MPAVNRSTVANWTTGDNEIQVASAPVIVTAIEVQGNPTQTTKCYLRIWNVANPTPGTDEPDIVIAIFKPNVDDGDIRKKVILSGGLRLPTAFSYGVYTTPHSGNTAPAAAAAPLSVQIFYIPN